MKISMQQLRELIREAAATELYGKLAVVVSPGNFLREAVVYDVDVLHAALGGVRPDDHAGVRHAIRWADDLAVGWVSIAKPSRSNRLCAGAWEVIQIAGPGKVVYGIGYAMSASGRLMPDRNNVSAEAQRAWTGVFNKDRHERVTLDDWRHEPGDVHDRHHTEETFDDCVTHGIEALDNAYVAEGWEKMFLARLQARHTGLLQELGVENAYLIESELLSSGSRFFQKKYRE